ncbi:SMC family ATPase [Streptomyces platensis]|uniref:SMC family ATPase n=1 Tax=Streptomyces platensis TaxID=58346 RepID=UPI002E25FD91|nr:SMC family ATPase [Streptomyces platensis]WUB84594.1 SMC family ATPase [Streptomyces platensis]
MYLHRLTVQAFGPFAHTEDVNFDDLTGAGLFLLRGDTGAGKTSVLDAVCFALYGNVPGIRPTHRLRSDHAPAHTRTRVILEFSVAGRRLKVTRTPKQSYPSSRAKTGTATAEATVQLHEQTGSSHTPDDWEPVCANHRDADREIEAVLGLSKDQFCQVVLLPQGDFAKFLRADAKDRASLLRRLFDTGRFQELQTWLVKRSKDAKDDLDKVATAVEHLSERIDQAVGPSLQDDVAEGQLARPDAQHPADALAWAQSLLTRARGAHTIAQAEEEASDKAHQKTKEDRQAATELAAHQTQYKQALAQRSALDQQATGHARLREQLDQGQRAEPLRSLLDGVERTALALQESRTTEESARNLLDAAHTQAAIPLLQLAHDEHHSQRGHVQALLPDEERHAQLGTQLAELGEKEEQAQADHDEAVRWLETWPATEAEHTALAETLGKAADHVPHLQRDAEALDTKLQAARSRDTLATQLTKAEEAETTRQAAALTAKKSWLDLRERRLDGMAGELAAELTEGAPCSVCGSPIHPAPAQLRADQPTREDEQTARTAYEQADAAHGQAARTRSDLAEQHAHTLGTAGATPVAELKSQLLAAHTAHQTACDQAGMLAAAQQELARLRSECDTRTQLRQEAKDRLIECQTRHKALTQQQHSIALAVDAARGNAKTLGDRIIALTRAAEHLSGAIDAAQATAAAAKRHDDARTAADHAAHDAGFPTREEATAARQPAPLLQRWQEELEQWGKDDTVVTSTLETAALIEASLQPPADLQAAADALHEAETRVKATAGTCQQARDRVTHLTSLIADLTARLTDLEPLQARYTLADRLARIASATDGANTLSMELEAYVLAARLEEIAEAANARLQAMTSDRYLLVHSDAKDTGRRGRLKAGLSLRVLDTWTGTERETSTLSGGETFTTSLALALGLADVVTQEASGRPLGTLFIDEGFGTLDEQNLQDVMDVLDQLRAGDRTVGIVSHVAELGRRIPSQLRVIKQRNGSTLRPVVDADL